MVEPLGVELVVDGEPGGARDFTHDFMHERFVLYPLSCSAL